MHRGDTMPKWLVLGKIDKFLKTKFSKYSSIPFGIFQRISKRIFLTFLGVPVHSALLQRASFIFPSPIRTFRTAWSSFEKCLVTFEFMSDTEDLRKDQNFK